MNRAPGPNPSPLDHETRVPRRRALAPPACPACDSEDVHRSRRKAWEHLLTLVDRRPFRCHECHRRFYAPWVKEAVSESRPERPGLSRHRWLPLASGLIALLVLGTAAAWALRHRSGPLAPPAASAPGPRPMPPPPAAPAASGPTPTASSTPPAGIAVPPQPPAQPREGFEVQLGAFRAQASAEELAQRARVGGLTVKVVTPGPGRPTHLYHVMLDPPFGKQLEAEKAAARIRRDLDIRAVVMRADR